MANENQTFTAPGELIFVVGSEGQRVFGTATRYRDIYYAIRRAEHAGDDTKWCPENAGRPIDASFITNTLPPGTEVRMEIRDVSPEYPVHMTLGDT